MGLSNSITKELIERNDNSCGYDTLHITLLIGKRFGSLV